MSSSERASTTAVPSSSGWASGTPGWIISSPCSSSGRPARNGDAAVSACTAEHTSCTYPGSVSSAERVPPPIVSACSSTSTDRPACASAMAAARPLGPEPTTTASRWGSGVVIAADYPGRGRLPRGFVELPGV